MWGTHYGAGMAINGISRSLCYASLAAMVWLPAAACADEALASNPAAIIPNAAAAGSDQPIATVQGDNLIGRDVTDSGDRVVGEIESVYVDAKGNVRKLIVTGIGRNPVAIDWKNVVVSDNGKKIAVTASRDQLMQAPGYRYAKPEQQGTVFTDDNASTAQVP